MQKFFCYNLNEEKLFGTEPNKKLSKLKLFIHLKICILRNSYSYFFQCTYLENYYKNSN